MESNRGGWNWELDELVAYQAIAKHLAVLHEVGLVDSVRVGGSFGTASSAPNWSRPRNDSTASAPSGIGVSPR